MKYLAPFTHGDEPGGHGCADIGAHDDACRLGEGQKAGIYKADHHDRGSGAALDQGGDEGSEKDAAKGTSGYMAEELFHAPSGHGLEAV